jgi:hypothetical protein
MKRSVASLLVGKLDGFSYYSPHLISVKFLEKVDHASIARFVDEGICMNKKIKHLYYKI